jgi:hypothetical protein
LPITESFFFVIQSLLSKIFPDPFLQRGGISLLCSFPL